MRYTKSSLFRAFTWSLIVLFAIFTTPHAELILPEAARLVTGIFVSTAYADGEDEDTGSVAAGAIAPAADTSQFSGAAMAKIPIELPPGRLGIAPHLALTYNSYQQNGWIGMGWGLDMGSIQRSTKYGVNYGATGSGANLYVANISGSSSELVDRSLDFGSGCYGAKVEGSLSKYCYNSSGGWVVTTKDGTRYYYGSTSASRQQFTNSQQGTDVFKWCLDAVIDVNGNYMTITYSKDQGTNGVGEIYPSRIDWTGNCGTQSLTNGQCSSPVKNPTSYVNFYLDNTRTDVPPMFTSNYQVKTAKRLKTIEVGINGSTLVRAYTLTYATSTSTQRSLLSTIQEFGNDATLNSSGTVTAGTAMQPVTLGWQTSTNTWTQINGINNFGHSAYLTNSGYPILTGDFNGDGRMDIARVGSTGVAVYVRNTDGTDGWTQATQLADFGASAYPSFNDYPIITGDFNGDGRMDIARVTDTGVGVYVRNTDGTDGWTQMTGIQNNFGHSSYPTNYVYPIFTGDFNGDGKTDIARVTGSGVQAYLSDGVGGWTAMQLLPNFSPGQGFTNINDYPIITGDFNGDGKTDIARVTDAGVLVYLANDSGGWTQITGVNNIGRTACPTAYQYPVFTGDFNGDGKTDIARVIGTGVQVYLSDGAGGWTAMQLLPDFGGQWYGDANGYPIVTGDFNGDGKTDIARVDTTGVVVYLSDGAGWRVLDIRNDFGANYYAGADNYPILAGDFNGDGKTDIARVNSTGVVTYAETLSSDLVTSITNSLGGTTTLAYTPSSAYQNTLMPFVLPTVSSITHSDGLGSSYTVKYWYSGGLFDYTDRDFRGFQKVTSYQMRDVATNAYESMTETSFLQDATRKGLMEKQITYSSCLDTSIPCTAQHKREVDNAWSVGTVTTGVTYPRLDLVVSINHDYQADPYYSYIAYTYDPTYLVVTQEYKCSNVSANGNNSYSCGTGASDSMQTNYTYENYPSYPSNWVLPKPTAVTVRNGAQQIASAKWMTYNSSSPIRQLQSEETCDSGCTGSGGSQNPIVYYTYTNLGNVSSVSDPRGTTYPLTYYTYDGTETFLNTTSRTVGSITYATTKVYDPGTGKVTSVIPPYLQGTAYATTYQYDALGRLLQETRPDAVAGHGGYTTYTYSALGDPYNQHIQKTEYITGGVSDLVHSSYTYFDGLGRTYEEWSTGPTGDVDLVSYTTYDTVGRVSQKSSPFFYGDTPVYTTLTYDGLSRITRTTYPDGGHVDTSYLGLTRVVCDQRSGSDQNNHCTQSIYDVYQRLKSTQNAAGTITTYTYDTLGNLTQTVGDQRTGGANITSTMTYNSLSRKTTMTDPDMGYWQYSYDKAGNLISQTDAKGQTITFTYDALNRLVTKNYPADTINNVPAYTVTNFYDTTPSTSDMPCPTDVPNCATLSCPSVAPNCALGMLTGTIDPSSNENKIDRVTAIDIMQRVTKSQKSVGNTTTTISKSYDSLGRTYVETYFPDDLNPSPRKKSFAYHYDYAGNTTGVQDDTSAYQVQYSNFTAKGQPQTAIYADQTRTTYTYDPEMGRLSTLVTEKTETGQQAVNCQLTTLGLALTTTYVCPVNDTAYTSQQSCSSACTETADCTTRGLINPTLSGSAGSPSFNIPTGGQGGYFITSVVGSGNTLSFMASNCTVQWHNYQGEGGYYALDCSASTPAGTVTVADATFSGSAGGQFITGVTTSGNTLSFTSQSCNVAWGQLYEGGYYYLNCSDPTPSGTITVTGATVSGGLGGTLASVAASGNTLTSTGTSCNVAWIPYAYEGGYYGLTCSDPAASGSITFTGTAPTYTCPFGNEYTCNSNNTCSRSPACIVTAELACPAGYTGNGSTCVPNAVVSNTYACSVDNSVYSTQQACSGTCTQTANCTANSPTNPTISGSAGGQFITGVTASGSTLSLTASTCGISWVQMYDGGYWYFGCSNPEPAGTITLNGVTASGSAGGQFITSVTASGNTLTFMAQSCTAYAPFLDSYDSYFTCSTPEPAGTITLTGATVSGSLSGILETLAGANNTLMSTATSIGMGSYDGGYSYYFATSTPASSGTITFTSTTPTYSCPYGSQYTCNSSHTCTSPGTCTLNSQLICPAGYTANGNACVASVYVCPFGSQYTCSGTTPQCTGTGTTVVSTLQNLSYTYDLKGNVTSLTDTVNSINHTYTYDNLDRLTSATGTTIGTTTNVYAETYQYDRLGNITYKSGVGSYTYGSSKPHAVTAINGTMTMGFTYDANGNMTQKAVSGGVTQNITWNADNKAVSITSINNTGTVQFTYDGNGNRVKKVGGSTTLYFGDAYEQRGNVGVYHIFANGQRVVSIRLDGNNQYYHSNNIGSASVITDSSGNTKETIEYYPFGSYRVHQTSEPSFPRVYYTFTDQEDDSDTGFYNYGARLYDPVIGRFISPDSVVQNPGDLQTFNRYSYCLNNPLIYIDPSGHWSFGDFFDDFFSGFLAALAFVAVAMLVGPAGMTLATMFTDTGLLAGQIAGCAAIGGMVGGMTSAALNGGNLGSIIQGGIAGGFAGAVSGGIVGVFPGADRAAVGLVMAGIGAATSYASGGLEGLAHFGAGMLGAMAGGYVANAMFGVEETGGANTCKTVAPSTNTKSIPKNINGVQIVFSRGADQPVDSVLVDEFVESVKYTKADDPNLDSLYISATKKPGTCHEVLRAIDISRVNGMRILGNYGRNALVTNVTDALAGHLFMAEHSYEVYSPGLMYGSGEDNARIIAIHKSHIHFSVEP